jgi:hypothetical protein
VQGIRSIRDRWYLQPEGRIDCSPSTISSPEILAMHSKSSADANDSSPAESAPPVPPGSDRRKRNIPVALDRRRQNAAEKRRTSERRRLIDPTTCERDYTDEETSFMRAMERYKRENRRPFPTWSEVLEVLRSLGYRKVAEVTDLPGVKRDAAGVPVKG